VLPVTGDLSIRGEGGKHLFVAKVLAPGLEILRRAAQLLAEPSERLPKRMRVEVGEPGVFEGIAEDRADRRGRAPAFAVQPGGFERAVRADSDSRRRKERVVEAPLAFLPEERDPGGGNRLKIVADREEGGDDRL